MDLAEAEGIARYLAEAGLPQGDSIAERLNQVPVILLAEIGRLRNKGLGGHCPSCGRTASEPVRVGRPGRLA